MILCDEFFIFLRENTFAVFITDLHLAFIDQDFISLCIIFSWNVSLFFFSALEESGTFPLFLGVSILSPWKM